ncbi:MAG TPA: DUF2156 domain-containing protein [Planctomycetota bacterium]|nr:DUF2156 domain-containing protein [Planctomycetota bacterium]
MPTSPERERARELLARFGRDVVAWQGLESDCRHWFLDDACVAYVDTGDAWVAAGSPWCASERVGEVAQQFVAAARRGRRRACFFGVERPEQFPGQVALRLGEQPLFDPDRWPATVKAHRRLAEQLRRARKKGVSVRRVEAGQLAAGAPLRAEVEALAAAWLRSRHLEPLGFLASVEPFDGPEHHRYYVAEWLGRVIALTSLVPVPGARGWLVEDTFRGERVPNGTTELLLDAAMRDAAGSAFVSLGLTPLSGPIAPLLRAAGAIGAPLYDFAALRAFRQRLHPDRWQPVWLLHGKHRRLLALFDSLRAFARGSLLAFGWRSMLRHPSGPPWLLAVPLVPWTFLLSVLAIVDDGRLLGFARPGLFAWVTWDALLAWLLFRTARRPRWTQLAWLAAAAGFDAALSLLHVVRVGLGEHDLATSLRLASVLAPIGGTLALAWAARRAMPSRTR